MSPCWDATPDATTMLPGRRVGSNQAVTTCNQGSVLPWLLRWRQPRQRFGCYRESVSTQLILDGTRDSDQSVSGQTPCAAVACMSLHCCRGRALAPRLLASADFASVPGHVWGGGWRGTCGGGRVAGDVWRGTSLGTDEAEAMRTARRRPCPAGPGESRLAGAAASESRLVAARLGRVSACNAKARLTGRMTCQAYIAG